MPTTPLLVVPLEVLATAAVIDECAANARGGQGELAAIGPTGGCGGVAGAAFGRTSAAWLSELARLAEQSGALAGLLRASAVDYLTTDRAAITSTPGGHP